MAKILVADDEADLEMLIKQKFRQKIREQVYEFVFAINGNDALEKIRQHPDVDIVLSDINMPEMDGLEAGGRVVVIGATNRPTLTCRRVGLVPSSTSMGMSTGCTAAPSSATSSWRSSVATPTTENGQRSRSQKALNCSSDSGAMAST